jgi:hypothetical protein
MLHFECLVKVNGGLAGNLQWAVADALGVTVPGSLEVTDSGDHNCYMTVSSSTGAATAPPNTSNSPNALTWGLIQPAPNPVSVKSTYLKAISCP